MKIRLILLPFSLIYGFFLWGRRFLYNHNILKSYNPELPTIAIGNLCMGGAGKTPHTEYLIKLLFPEWRIATLSRGYGRKTKGYLLANENEKTIPDVSMIGDEPLQYYYKFPGIKVAVAEKRKEGIIKLMEKDPSLQIILLDDAYQHIQVNAGLKILLTEYEKPYFNDFPIPSGNLREFSSAAAEADIIIITKTPENITGKEQIAFNEKIEILPEQKLFYTTYIYGNPQPQTEPAKKITFGPETNIILVTGIAHPKPLYDKLKQQHNKVSHLKFSDHHVYNKKDIKIIKRKFSDELKSKNVVFTTEKDMMRLRTGTLKDAICSLPVFTIPVEVKFLFEEEKIFNTIIKQYVRSNSIGN